MTNGKMGDSAFNVEFEVLDHIGTLSQHSDRLGRMWYKQLNIVKWNVHDPKFDIREWCEDGFRMSKGVTLTREEALALYEALGRAFAKETQSND